MNEIAENLARVRETIAGACRRAGRPLESVRLVAISKKQPAGRIRIAYESGQREFGENYVQDLEKRRASMPKDIVWHMVGHLQTNKARRAIRAALLHSVDSERLARALSRAMEEEPTRVPRELDLLIEVNVALEEQKAGVHPHQVEPLIDAVRAFTNLRVRGLMCIPRPGSGRSPFAELRGLRDAVASKTGLELPELSMGMSSDYEDAVLEGATLVRVGTAIFGERVDAPDPSV